MGFIRLGIIFPLVTLILICAVIGLVSFAVLVGVPAEEVARDASCVELFGDDFEYVIQSRGLFCSDSVEAFPVIIDGDGRMVKVVK